MARVQAFTEEEEEAAIELLKRKRSQQSTHSFALNTVVKVNVDNWPGSTLQSAS